MSIARASFANGLRVGFFIALVGPLIGAIVFLAGLVAFSGGSVFESGTGGGVVERVFQYSYSVLVFGLIFGIVPAALSGLVVGIITARRGGFSIPMAIGVSLAGALALPLVSFFASRGEPGASDPGFFGSLSILYGIIALIGVVAALICRWVLVRLGWIVPTAA